MENEDDFEIGIELRKTSEYIIVNFSKPIQLDLFNCKELNQVFIDENQKQDEIRDWILDLSNVQFLDSSGLATLINQNRFLQGEGFHLYLYGLKPVVKQLYNTGGLSKVFEIIYELPQEF